ncbi:MAG: hypothetical protein GXP40_11780 [Chloroflexi bacterium]|nr:hypothetical protein [Chloroflexota bacterium]
MSGAVDLKELERKAWKSYFNDGLWDIYLGLILFSMGMSRWLYETSLSDNWQTGIYVGLLGVATLLFWAGKRFVTVPRMGRVKFGAGRKTRQKKVRLILFVSVIFVVFVLLVALAAKGGGFGDGLPWKSILPGVYALNMLVVFGAGAYFLEFERLYFIGVMFALPVPLDAMLTEFAGIDLGASVFIVPAALVVAVGSWHLARFMRAYPVVSIPGQEAGNGRV